MKTAILYSSILISFSSGRKDIPHQKEEGQINTEIEQVSMINDADAYDGSKKLRLRQTQKIKKKDKTSKDKKGKSNKSKTTKSPKQDKSKTTKAPKLTTVASKKKPNHEGFNCAGNGNKYCEKEYNIKECNYDGGDCDLFNSMYPNCDVETPSYISDGLCDKQEPYFTEECGFDGGDCIGFPPNCHITDTWAIGDGICHPQFNTTDCEYDGGDCIGESNGPTTDDENYHYYR